MDKESTSFMRWSIKRIDQSSRVITQTIINFASTLGLKTIAEFVEDKESLEILEKMGVDYVQGYYIGKPEKDLNTIFR